MCVRYTMILFPVLTSLALGQSAPNSDTIARLLQEDHQASFEAFVQLRQSLEAGTDAQTLREALCEKLAQAASPADIRKLGAVLSVAPDEAAVTAMIGKLDHPDPLVKQAGCQGLCQLGARRPIQPDRLVESAMTRLNALVRDEAQASGLVDSAVMAMTVMGPRGTEALIASRAIARRAANPSNVYYSALWRTGDPRTLPFLRDAIVDTRLPEGLRIQAVHAVGRLAALLKSQGEPFEPREQQACLKVLSRTLDEARDDQLSGAALRAIGEFDDYQMNATINAAVMEALSSQSPIRIQAALDAIYAAPSGPPEPQLLERVKAMAGSGDEGCKATAQAILDRIEVSAGPQRG